MKINETNPREKGFVLWGHCQNILDDPRSIYFRISVEPGMGQKAKIQLFQNMTMLNIKFKGMTNAATCKHTLLRGVGSKGRSIFSEYGYVAYQIKGKKYRLTWKL